MQKDTYNDGYGRLSKYKDLKKITVHMLTF